MSAILEKQTEFGTSANFWRLQSVEISREGLGALNVLIYGYISEEAFNSGASPISHFQKTIIGSDIPFNVNNLEPGTPAYALFGLTYMSIMNDTFFEGAIQI